MKKALIVYYSMDGNTNQIAEQLQKATGADRMQLDTVTPYVGSDDEIVRQCEEEVQRGYLPPLQPETFPMEDYDVILLGTPTWWFTMAAPIHSYIAAHDWTGKLVIPFQTHCGWPGKGIQDLERACKGAKFAHAKAIHFNPRQFGLLVTPQEEVDRWVDAIAADLKNS